MDIDSEFRNLNLKSPEDHALMQMDAEESAQVKVQIQLEFDRFSNIHLFINWFYLVTSALLVIPCFLVLL